MSNFVLVFAVLTVLGEVSCQKDDLEWNHEMGLDKGVTVKWMRDDPVWLTMEMSAPTNGYVAIGFSPNGGMAGSDIVVGWVNAAGQGVILDMYATANEAPKLDKVQNYELLSAQQAGDRTTIRFRRKWNTCDTEHDNSIEEDTERLIWAYHPDDPAEVPGTTPVQYTAAYHGEMRGVRKTFVRIPGHHELFPDIVQKPHIKHWDIRMTDNEVNGESDVVHCTIVKFPGVGKKHHLIGFQPLLHEGAQWNVHHMILYECIVPESEGGTKKVFEDHVAEAGGRCFRPSMPPSWTQFCVNTPIVWTSGSEGLMFPDIMGFPLGEEHGGTTYFRFEIHYDNPHRQTFKDSTGLRLIYTDLLRPNDGGVFVSGHKISPFEMVPPSMADFTAKAYCSSECTRQLIPPSGITAISVMLHGHYTARKLEVKHIRNGKELPFLAKETKYDFFYQQTRALQPGRQILPGDELLNVCEYDTRNKTKAAFGGITTRDEMCLAFIYYYPKILLEDCKSQPEFNSFLGALGIRKVAGEILTELNMPYEPKDGQTSDYPDNPFVLKNATADTYLNAFDVMHIVEADDPVTGSCLVADYMKRINWAEKGKEIESKWINGKHYAFCTGPKTLRYPLKNYVVSMPQYEPLVQADPCKN